VTAGVSVKMARSETVIVRDPVRSYLGRRTGITELPDCIRFHAALNYRHDDGIVTQHPTIIAKVQDADGNSVATHRTYLTSTGEKANVPTVKKLVGTLSASSAVRLFPAASCNFPEFNRRLSGAFALYPEHKKRNSGFTPSP